MDYIDRSVELSIGEVGLNLAQHLAYMRNRIKDAWRTNIDYAAFSGSMDHSGNRDDFFTNETQDSHDLVGPAPMQTCPPGYVLNGAGVIYRECFEANEGCIGGNT